MIRNPCLGWSMEGSKELLNLFWKRRKVQIPHLHQVIMVKIQAVERMKVGLKFRMQGLLVLIIEWRCWPWWLNGCRGEWRGGQEGGLHSSETRERRKDKTKFGQVVIKYMCLVFILTNFILPPSDFQYQKQVTAAGIPSEQPGRIRIFKERWKTLPCLIFRYEIQHKFLKIKLY